MEKVWKCKDEGELIDIANDLLLSFPDLKKIALYGEMGVGKTTFIKAICEKLKVIDIVSSPTFSIVNEYLSNQKGRIYHFDFYRLENEQEAFDIGCEEYFYGDDYCLVEWPERIKNILPTLFAKIYIDLIDGYRIIKLTNYD